MEKKYPYVLVVGRIPSDDEDYAGVYENVTLDEAKTALYEELWSEEESDPTQRQGARDRVADYYGSDFYFNYVFVSDTPIKDMPNANPNN